MTAPAPGPPTPRQWIRAYLRVQLVADRDIMRMLRGSLADINRDIKAVQAAATGTISDAVRIEQLRRIRAAMLREQGELFSNLRQPVAAARALAAARAIQLGVDADSTLFKLAGRGAQAELLRRGLLEGLTRTTEIALARMGQSTIPLAERIYRTQVWMNGRVDTMINSALARGQTVQQFAATARDWYNPATPGGVRYAALRLARTEINNAYHAVAVNAAAEKPWVKGMKWNLSGSHPKPDECDRLASADQFNMGAGVFPARDVPRKPHPQCLCVVVPVLEDEDDFFNNLLGGNYDDYLARKRAGLRSPGAPLQPTPPTPPPRKAPARKAAAAPAPTATATAPARRTATRSPDQLAARTHVTAITKGLPAAAAGTRKVALDELRRQADLTPKAMQGLKGVTTNFTSYGLNTGVGAYYSPSLNHVVFHPRWFGSQADYDRINAGFASACRSGWFATRSADGLDPFRGSVVAHEYGHHIHYMLSNPQSARVGIYSTGPGWGLTAKHAEELLPALSKELGVSMPRYWSPGQSFSAINFDEWVKNRKAKLKTAVSEYGTESSAELLAEIWSEYSVQGTKARPHIRRLGMLIHRLVEEAQ